MKKTTRTIAAVSALFLILSLATVGAATTATQNVVLSITDSYTGVAAIRVFDGETTNPPVIFSDSYTGNWQVTDAGTEATQSTYSAYDSLSEKSGGSLQYTVAGLSNQMITVHSGTANYTTGSLYVLVGDPQDATGSAIELEAHGDVIVSGDTINNKFTIPQGTARTIINAIPGTNTYTGTASGTVGEVTYVPGAPLIYGFDSAPGVGTEGTIAVTYTITADNS